MPIVRRYVHKLPYHHALFAFVLSCLPVCDLITLENLKSMVVNLLGSLIRFADDVHSRCPMSKVFNMVVNRIHCLVRSHPNVYPILAKLSHLIILK